MNRSILRWSVVALVLCVAQPAFAARVSGVITDASVKPIQGITVIARGASGRTFKTAVSGPDGEYSLSGVERGKCLFAIDPGKTGFKKGKPVEAFVSDRGVTLNWVVSISAEPVALAQPGTNSEVAASDPFGLTWAQFLMVGGLVAAAGTVGGIGAAGGFSGSSEPVASSSK